MSAHLSSVTGKRDSRGFLLLGTDRKDHSSSTEEEALPPACTPASQENFI